MGGNKGRDWARTIAVVDGGNQGGDEDPEQVGGLQLLGQEVAEQQRGRVQERHAAEVQGIDCQGSRPNHVGDLRPTQ